MYQGFKPYLGVVFDASYFLIIKLRSPILGLKSKSKSKSKLGRVYEPPNPRRGLLAPPKKKTKKAA